MLPPVLQLDFMGVDLNDSAGYFCIRNLCFPVSALLSPQRLIPDSKILQEASSGFVGILPRLPATIWSQVANISNFPFPLTSQAVSVTPQALCCSQQMAGLQHTKQLLVAESARLPWVSGTAALFSCATGTSRLSPSVDQPGTVHC